MALVAALDQHRADLFLKEIKFGEAGGSCGTNVIGSHRSERKHARCQARESAVEHSGVVLIWCAQVFSARMWCAISRLDSRVG
jgi:hypothetical protein